jgi:hypothetical protein
LSEGGLMGYVFRFIHPLIYFHGSNDAPLPLCLYCTDRHLGAIRSTAFDSIALQSTTGDSV